MRKFIILFVGLVTTLVGFAQNNTADSIAKAEETRIKINNLWSEFKFNNNGIVSGQDETKDYVIYEVPGMSATELKAAALTTISSMYNSPKDVITNLSDNMIQLDGYIGTAYMQETAGSFYPVDISFSWVIQFKDGKIRFNKPSIKQILVTGVPLVGVSRLDMSKPLTTLIKDKSNRISLVYKLNKLITTIGEKAKTDNDW